MTVPDIGAYDLGWNDGDQFVYRPEKGLSENTVRDISAHKSEPEWMRDFRVSAYKRFERKPMLDWFADNMPTIDFNDIYYYIKPTDKTVSDWDMLPPEMAKTYERLGIPEAEHKYLAGVTSQYESEVVYHKNREDLESLGVLFTSMDQAVKDHPELVQKYLGTVIPPGDNKFAALNSAVWSGGSFIYVPPGVTVDQPLQAYFRINSENAGQFERTLIIADEGANVHYIEGCSAPVYSTDSLHSAVVELVALPGSRIRYSTIQNWSPNVYNLVTKRGVAHAEATVEWIDGNLGCLAGSSRVITPSGPKAIVDVRAGDLVQSWDDAGGQFVFREVVAHRFSGEQPVHEVRAGGRCLLATSNHPVYSYRYDASQPKKLGRYALDYVRTDEMSSAIIPATSIDFGEAHKIELPSTVRVFQSSNQWSDSFTATRTRGTRLSGESMVTDCDLMWLFGLYVGDGSIESTSSVDGTSLRWAKVQFSVPGKDRARAKLVQIMTELMPGVTPTERADGRLVAWNSVELAEIFTTQGFHGNSRTKRLPDWIQRLPEAQRLAFVAGYLDSDGCAIAARRRFSIKSVNRPLLEDVAWILTTLGVSSNLCTEFSDDRQVEIQGISAIAHGAHRIEFALDPRFAPHLSDQLRALVESIPPASLIHNRSIGGSKLQLSPELEVRNVVVSEPSADRVPTYDIEVAGTGNFVAEGFIVHNSKLTMKYPAVVLAGPKAHGEVLSVAYAGAGQHQDAGAKMTHAAPETTSVIDSKSISKDGGRTTYRGLVRVEPGATNVKSHVRCDALILDDDSRSDTYPYMEVEEHDARVAHEATVSKVGEDQLFYLMSRGLDEKQATALIVNGFIEPVVKTLPMEYAVELSRLIEMNMEGAVG